MNASANATDVRAMPLGEAKAIYRARYWSALRCDDLPAGLDYAVFDYGVNSGTARAAKALRRLLGLAEEGGVDAAVLAALRSRDVAQLVTALCDERLAFLQRLRTWPVFGRGWSRRVAEVRATALAMAQGQAPSPSKPAMRSTAGRTAGGVIVGGGVAAGAHALGASPEIVLAIVAVSVAAGVAWLFWRHTGAQLGGKAQ